ncbi:hypothetical protein SAY87_008773 [Trapa incisa]|uniref:Defensin-like protein n=2 Tax=Trapa TaxID=22665 RepID=A0AAN7LXY9_TRANT|nr:hypothetical protein SAY87_008773 [Trapa incisa]KAK4798118.1 hypothetical protein SAY86_030444 [Trapa natans]
MELSLRESLHEQVRRPQADSFTVCWMSIVTMKSFSGRVFCKKGCDADGDTWEECLEECTEICYKDPVLKNKQWSAYIDRSPGADNYSEECFHACVSGCGYKFEIHPEKVLQVRPNRPPKPPRPVVEKPIEPSSQTRSPSDDVPSTSA